MKRVNKEQLIREPQGILFSKINEEGKAVGLYQKDNVAQGWSRHHDHYPGMSREHYHTWHDLIKGLATPNSTDPNPHIRKHDDEWDRYIEDFLLSADEDEGYYEYIVYSGRDVQRLVDWLVDTLGAYPVDRKSDIS